MRNVLALVPKSAAQLVAATIRTVFVQPEPEMARQQWRHVADGFRSRYPKLATLLDGAETDVLAYLAFPSEHWRQIWSNNPLERLNREVKRRTDVVGIFPNDPSILRLVGMVLAEQHDEWQVGRRYFSAESLAKLASAALAVKRADALTPAASWRPALPRRQHDGNHHFPHIPEHIPACHAGCVSLAQWTEETAVALRRAVQGETNAILVNVQRAENLRRGRVLDQRLSH